MFSVTLGDMTMLEMDATESFANISLLDGGLVDGALPRPAAGRLLLRKKRTLEICQGGAKDPAFLKLKARIRT